LLAADEIWPFQSRNAHGAHVSVSSLLPHAFTNELTACCLNLSGAVQVRVGVETRVKHAMTRAQQLEQQQEETAAQHAAALQQLQQQQADLEAALGQATQEQAELRQQLAAAEASGVFVVQFVAGLLKLCRMS
jgi:septal ring factor EnvC (AmiA/AmiB activator)